MLTDRGCTHVARIAEGDLQTCLSVHNGHVLSGEDDAGEMRHRVYLHHEDRVGVKYARSILDANKEPGTCIVIVSTEGPTPFTRRACSEYGTAVQFMLVRDLCVNKTRHCLVPRHERVEAPPPGVEVAQLPRILDQDKIVQYYNWPVGTVVRIRRCFGGHEPVDYYRVVVRNAGGVAVGAGGAGGVAVA